MDRASIEFLRELVPVEDEEFRVTLSGSRLSVAWLAMAVNSGLMPVTHAWLDEAAIEDASKHFKCYEVRPSANALSAWVACKPVLMCQTKHGLVLLDGRQRAAQWFSKGHKTVPAWIIGKKDGRMMDLALHWQIKSLLTKLERGSAL